ncbi:MAG: histidine--tRNA ligase [Bacilli bacterium]|nr:histidine--tRNA ligase [Bacilli bacterium]MDD3895471.1 histidine--tRNA ligase [Bacilli bacterium]MDD4407440.1 histidine--tRNA ligase [Bacilli bacterium]
MITKPKGTMDVYGIDAKKREYVNEILRSVCNKYNYNYIETPIFEASELYHRGVGEDTDIVNKETYTFKDRGDRSLTLRPEGTAGVVRWFIENKLYGNITEPTKVFYNGKMYRYERPQAGRYREFTQFGVEFIGSDDILADIDVISVAYNTYNLLGLKNVTIVLNTLGDQDSRDKYRDALIKYFNPLINSLCEDCQKRLKSNPLRILDCKIDSDQDLLKKAPKIIDYLNKESLTRYNNIKEYLELMDINYQEDFSLVRGLDYYDHTIFEIIADVPGLGNIALGGGGRYNGLIEKLGGPNIPAVGFAMGYDRTILAMDNSNVNLKLRDDIDVYIMYVSKTEKETAAYLLQDLRLNGFITETDYLNKSLKAQFKSIERLNPKYLIILNDQDLKENKVTLKDNLTKEEQKIEINNLIDYLDTNI